ncbi:3-deoxy-7-phosphoheptulonate synthase [Anaerococcus porci]|uniref:3-deoxy-7-phosphoheptulonate synthase n=1 Tax=Anaerococcus porci TaxID=2652269 RepID=A0A6N7VVC1_9FIRM|nr:3-deoxy-7-phosphoheptulonate synthase [Anaerococcus porci]MDY3006886.1 3-deoxy-7-phosphoheptulonate synthase [Anaerococcus porci]MSS77787.1 3-deoxy-7-phosphoheptulonate synthase [Anaerococcus porci]
MIIKLKNGVKKEKIEELIKEIEDMGLKVSTAVGENTTILGLLGDTSKVSKDDMKSKEVVDDVIRIQEPYKKANRKFHPEDTIIRLNNGTQIGGGTFVYMAGPCSVESEEQIVSIAKKIKESGATILRGGAFKPRTSPYSFQGYGPKAIDYLVSAKKETGLALVSEIMEINQLKYFDDIDILQVGARNMQNFDLLKELGKTDKPILLKRGLSATYEELLMAAEYIMSNGNTKVILCERGIRTFETATRNTLDVTAVPFLHEKTHLPVIIDPSHAAGIARYVRDLSLSAVAVGADGLMIEVHENPAKAFSDGAQCIIPDEFDMLLKATKQIHELRKSL